MNRTNALIKNTAIIAFGKISTQIIAFLLVPIYTNFLNPGDYGTVDLIASYISIFVPVVSLNLETAIFRFLVDARGDSEKIKIITSSVAMTVLPIIILAAIAFGITSLFVPIPYVGYIILAVFASAISATLLQFARGVGENRKFVAAGIIASLLNSVFAILLIVLGGMSAGAILLATALANIVCSVYLVASLGVHRYVRLKKFSRSSLREVLAYSIPTIPNNISWWIISISDRTIVSFVLGAVANGVYAIANKFSVIFGGFFGIFALSWQESATLHIKSEDRDAFFSSVFNSMIKIFGSMAIAAVPLMSIVFPILAGAEYNEAYRYVPILIAAAFLNGLVTFYGAIYTAAKLTKRLAATSVLSAALNIAINITMIQFVGLWAAAISTLVAYATVAIYRHHDLKNQVRISGENSVIVSLGAIFMMVCVLYYLNNPVLNWVNIGLAGVVGVGMNLGMIQKLPGLAKSFLKRSGATLKK